MPLDNGQLPPPAEDQKRQWSTYLNSSPVYTSDLMKYRYGYLARTPLESSRNLINSQHMGVPVPHPQHKDYTAIETAKRNRAEAEQRARMNQRVRIHGVEQRAPWIPPNEHPDLLMFRPNINHFTKQFRPFRLPKW
jgi:hypothetical protein